MHKFSLKLCEVEIVCVFMYNVNGRTCQYELRDYVKWNSQRMEWSKTSIKSLKTCGAAVPTRHTCSLWSLLCNLYFTSAYVMNTLMNTHTRIHMNEHKPIKNKWTQADICTHVQLHRTHAHYSLASSPYSSQTNCTIVVPFSPPPKNLLLL